MNSKKVELYSQIENLIINWNNDGSETAGHLTRQIMELLKSDENWINVKECLPECHSQHRLDYASGYLLGYTKYGEFEITQLWQFRQEDGSYKYHWEGDDEHTGDYITHWIELKHPK